MIEVIEGDTAAGGFEQIAIFMFAAVDGFCVETGGFGDVEKGKAERRAGDWRWKSFGCGAWSGVVGWAGVLGWGLRGDSKGQDVLEGEDQRCSAKAFHEAAAVLGHVVRCSRRSVTDVSSG